MQKLSKYKLNKYSRNLDFFFNFATKQDINNGLQWYNEANKIITNLALIYNYDFFIVANVLSALSPRNRWSQNIKDTEKVLKAVNEGKDANSVRVCTFNNNKFKAFNIAKGNLIIDKLSPKTYNFTKNIAHLDSEALTVDIWHLRACLKQFKSIKTAQIGKLAYQQIKTLTIRKAEKLGLKGFEYQAIIWLAAQRFYQNNQ